MGNAVDINGKPLIDCQSCRGPMSKVGKAGREGWLSVPTCQSCHHDGTRELSAVDAVGSSSRFNLYHLSADHGGLQCESCHGADYRSTVLSQVKTNKTFAIEQGQKRFILG